MAYSAVISLMHTIERLLYSSHIPVLLSFPEIIRSAYKELNSLKKVLERLDDSSSNCSMERLNTLDEQIRDAVYKLEDVIESHVSNQFLSQYEERSLGGKDGPPLLFSLDFKELKQDSDFFRQTAKKMMEEYIKELSNPMPEKFEDDAADRSRPSNLRGNKSKVVYDLFRAVKDDLTQGESYTFFVFLFGMPGIGKTSIAKEVYEDQAIVDYFECRAWVRVGPKYGVKEIMCSLLAQVNAESDKILIGEEGDEKYLAKKLLKSLNRRRYLFVLDDMWKSGLCGDLGNFLPGLRNGSRVLVTSTMEQVADRTTNFIICHEVPFLSKEESWDLLREKVFGELSISRELEKAGKKIAENCDGLPLTIVTVADILSKADKTPEYWNEVAEEQTSVFFDAYEEMSKVLLPSYIYLPQNLKACFLYIGILPKKYEISRTKLINLWSSEGFLESDPSRGFEHSARECLTDLVSRNVVLAHFKLFVSPWILNFYATVKYRLHSAFLHLCEREARKIKFHHVLNRYAEDASTQCIESQRRLCIQNNVLLGIKNLNDTVASASTARSLLCTGPNHQYPVPICLEYLRLLRVLDAVTIRFYEFPIDVLKLIQLRYFAMTYGGKLPSSISKLLNLEYFIIHKHLSIVKSFENSLYLPVEIWDMKELKHLEITGRDLPDPCGRSPLPNLLTLIGVSGRSCTRRVLERIPNIKKLGIQIELAADNVNQPSSCFNHVSQLHLLETLTCTIMNPIISSVVVAPRLIFPPGLNKLSLSGFGYPWEKMDKIASLPNLKILKLRCYAFRGPKWETRGVGFPALEYLLIEDSDLVEWTFEDLSFQELYRLSFKHCYKLEKIRGKLRSIMSPMIEVVDSNPSAAIFANQVPDAIVYVHSSFEDGRVKS